jgi:hypothetical protein
MSQRLSEIVRFRGDRLFNGAVSINWFGTDSPRCRAASEAFVFHGPQYHGVQQQDVGLGHGHKLMDTASFARVVIRRCYSQEDQPFTLAIAGYGTGKSHLGLTLAALLSDPDGETAAPILAALEAADKVIGSEVQALLDESKQPCLVVALNGMQSFDLTAEVTRQIARDLKRRGLDTKPLDELRPRFSQAAALIRMSNAGIVEELLVSCEVNNVEDILRGLEQQDENIYSKVHGFFAARGMAIMALAGESARDVIDVAVREYCGTGKPYQSLVILFDEFGRYTEFATVRSQIAGSGALQDLFEAVQAHSAAACFVGFIQFELSAYVQRIAPEYRNEILRYVTRYQAANRVYLSINLETLIASLLEKRQPEALDKRFDSAEARQESQETIESLVRWFPQVRNHRLWGDLDQFHTVIRKGCWPLSPFSTWLLFYLTAAGKHLQERSALALLGDVLARHEGAEVTDGKNWALAPADLWSDALQQELLTAEEGGQQGSITHAFASVNARHGTRFTDDLHRILRSAVLASKMGLQSANKDDAIEALAELSGISLSAADKAAKLLQEEYNVLEWDEAFKEFDILGDAVPRTQFLSFVRQRVAATYDEAGKAKLFASKAATWCDLLSDLDCDFAEDNHITTREWRYRSVTTNLDLLPMQIKLATDRWKGSFGVDEPRGTIVYCYVEPSRDSAMVLSDAAKLLRAAARESDATALPMLVVLLCDEKGDLGQALAEFAVLEETISEEDRVRFGNLIPAHKEKMRQVVRDHIEGMIRQRRYVTGLKENLDSHRLSRAGTELFAKTYNSPIPFPFDGFSTARGNAADTCQELTTELLSGKLDFDGVIAKPIKAKNRAVTVLKEAWGIFTRNGEVSRRPAYPALRTITEKWDDALGSEKRRLSVAEILRQLCLPPHGANIASAGLILGVFVAPRAEKLVIVRGGQQIAVAQWIQDGLFKGKFIDLTALNGVDLVSIGEASSEWETLLDEWEQAANHLARRNSLQRAIELKNRVPVPPSLAYREVHLREQACLSIQAISKLEESHSAAITKIQHGLENRDVTHLSWGAASLRELSERMTAEKPAWTDLQIAELQTHFETARQAIVMHIKEWLSRQSPRSDAPDAVGDFKHRMVRLVGGNLKRVGLGELALEVETRTAAIIRQAETIAEAHQLVRNVSSWLTTHGDPARVVRVAELRSLRDVGKDFSSKLQGMSERISLAELGPIRTKLSTFLTKLKDAEVAAVKRASGLWQTKLRVEDDIERLIAEVEALVTVFENLPNDQEDILLMRRALRLYQKDFQQLANDLLTWPEFEILAERLRQDANTMFAENEIPWPPDEAIGGFLITFTKQRKDASASWIQALECEATNVTSMSAADANRLHSRTSSPPPILTEPHVKRLKQVVKNLEIRLEELALEWLVEKFSALPDPAKKTFLGIVTEMMRGN